MRQDLLAKTINFSPCLHNTRISGEDRAAHEARASSAFGVRRPPYFAAVGLPFSSTKTSSKGLSPIFSGKCLPLASHCVAPAFIGAS